MLIYPESTGGCKLGSGKVSMANTRKCIVIVDNIFAQQYIILLHKTNTVSCIVLHWSESPWLLFSSTSVLQVFPYILNIFRSVEPLR